MKSHTYVPHLIKDAELYKNVFKEVSPYFDTSMKSRLTASFGVPYNYNQMTYPANPFPPTIKELAELVSTQVNWMPNNCLVNYYEDGSQGMGWHSDQIEDITEGTGVAVITLYSVPGNPRYFHIREIADNENVEKLLLEDGSLLYMSAESQSLFQHSLPRELHYTTSRLSLSYRLLK